MQRSPSQILVFICDLTLRTCQDSLFSQSSLTLHHLLCEVHEINKSHLNLLPFAWQEYPQDLD